MPQIDAEFVFPPASSVPTDGFLLLVASDPDEFRARHSIPDVVPIVGPFGGRLDNSGERITLEYRWPGEDGRLLQIDLDRVDYNDREPWPTEAAGLGATLERIAPSLHGNDPTSWAASTVEGGTPGRRNSVTEAGASGGLQLPGDIDGNAALNLTDAVGLLGMLFQGAGPPISCDEAFGRAALLDANGDRGVNLSDAVFVLNHLFVQGPPHVLGTDCVTIDGCEPGCEGR